MGVKFIASLGPASNTYSVIRGLAEAGVSGFRVNLAHGDEVLWRKLIRLVRSVERDLSGFYSVIVDLRGPSIRLGVFNDVINVKAGDRVVFSLEGFSKVDKRVPLPNEVVVRGVAPDDLIVMDDGRVRFRVVAVKDSEFVAEALTDGVLRSGKSLAFPDRDFNLPVLSEKDVKDLKVVCSEGVDYVGVSLVKNERDLKYVREVLEGIECDALLISKIETKQAIKNLSEVVKASDAVLVARGDLGMNFGLEEIPILQKKVVNEALKQGKPVIVATQLLESMINNPVPTRAEVVDVANAVLEGVDALMLTGETAVGNYPLEAVRWLKRIADKIESAYVIEAPRVTETLKRRYAKGVTELAEDLNGKLLIYSMKGTTAYAISSLRPKIETYVGVPTPKIARKLAILWGLETRVIEAKDYYEGLEKLYVELLNEGKLKEGDIALLTYGFKDYEQLIKIRQVVRGK